MPQDERLLSLVIWYWVLIRLKWPEINKSQKRYKSQAHIWNLWKMIVRSKFFLFCYTSRKFFKFLLHLRQILYYKPSHKPLHKTLLWASFWLACSWGYEMTCNCFLLDGCCFSRNVGSLRRVGSESGMSSWCAWMGLLGWCLHFVVGVVRACLFLRIRDDLAIGAYLAEGLVPLRTMVFRLLDG